MPFCFWQGSQNARRGKVAKGKQTAFFCKECGYESAKWLGQCPGCKEWNTLVEEPVVKASDKRRTVIATSNTPVTLSEISIEEEDRITSGMEELDRVLGGGIIKGSLVLVGGDPGIGKSTLLIQMCRFIAGFNHKVLYISGEESLKQIKVRAERIGQFNDNLTLLCETNLDNIEAIIKKHIPEVVIIDSIQTMYREEISSAPGSVSQVRESTAILMQIAKGLGITIFIVGHVTKEGVVAGPRVLEHMVDTVLYFEGDRQETYRILRSVKNRFGSTNEIGVFEMQEKGLCEVANASEYMLSGRPEGASGSVVTCLMEGTRPLLVEIQALICRTNFNIPRRTAVGTDPNRVNLLMAVIEKRLGIRLSECDAYINIAGGIKVNEPALDLGIVIAILSNYKNIEISDKIIAYGEVGLSGEIRAVSQSEARIGEAVKLGFEMCIIPEVCKANLEKYQKKIKVVGVKNLNDVLNAIC